MTEIKKIKTNAEKSAEKRLKTKDDYMLMVGMLEGIINILERTSMHADIKEQLTSIYSNFKLRGNK